jgi:hypothetical protein
MLPLSGDKTLELQKTWRRIYILHSAELTRMEVHLGFVTTVIFYPDTYCMKNKKIYTRISSLLFTLSDRSQIHSTSLSVYLRFILKKPPFQSVNLIRNGHERPAYGEARSPGALVLNVVAHRQLVILVSAHAHKQALN